MSDDEIPTSVRGCARCGEDHEGLEYRSFRHPVPDADGDFTMWAPCPATGDPILLRFVKKDDPGPVGRLAICAQRFDPDAGEWKFLTGGQVADLLREPHEVTSAVNPYAYVDPEAA